MLTIPKQDTTELVVKGPANATTIRHLREMVMSVLAKRLKEARLRAGISQERLGLAAGLDEMSASTRMNRYEQGKRSPDLELVERIGQVLGLPAAYFFTADDDMAEMLALFYRLDTKSRLSLVESLRTQVEVG